LAATSPTPASTPDQPGTGFRCNNCGATLAWDPDADALACEHCGTRIQVPRADGAIVERALDDVGSAARGLGLELRALRCGTCGATVALDGAATAEACVFCGSANVLAQQHNRNALRPESVVPLDVGRAVVEQNFRAWLRGLWFRPNALRKVARFDAVGVYVPYWTFDARVHSDWSADAGHYYYVTEMVPVVRNGRTSLQPRQVRKVRWVPAWGQRDDAFDDLLVHASRGLPEELVSELGGFDTKALVPYRPEYLAGWRAEEYQVDLDSAWKLARERMIETQIGRCSGDVPGDTQRNLRVSNRFDDVRWKHVLLPMWSLTYGFGGKRYAVLIHGQNGRVHGDAPLSWVKILLLVLGILAVAGAIALIAVLASE
jgi:DNA-directed RNA polymerase subunit RPC12/RpoP